MRSIQNLPWAARLGEGRFTVNKIFFGKVKTGHFPRKNEENLFLARMETGRGNEGWTSNVQWGWTGGVFDSLPDSLPVFRVPEMRMPKEVWQRACSLYLAGMDWDTIADKLKVNKTTLCKRASLEGITKVKKEMKDSLPTEISVKTEKSLEALSAIVRSKLAADAASTLERIETYDLDGLKDEGLRETILASVAKRSALTFGWAESGEAPSVSVNILGALPDRSEVRVEPETK